MTTGDIITCIGMTEPSGGSDLQAMKTHAIRDGDDWILNGSKVSQELCVQKALYHFSINPYSKLK